MSDNDSESVIRKQHILNFPETPLIINNNTSPEQFYDEYLFGLNHHIPIENRKERYPGSLLLTPGQMQTYLSIILEEELPLLEDLTLNLITRYNPNDPWYANWYYLIFNILYQLYNIPANKQQMQEAFIKYRCS